MCQGVAEIDAHGAKSRQPRLGRQVRPQEAVGIPAREIGVIDGLGPDGGIDAGGDGPAETLDHVSRPRVLARRVGVAAPGGLGGGGAEFRVQGGFVGPVALRTRVCDVEPFPATLSYVDVKASKKWWLITPR